MTKQKTISDVIEKIQQKDFFRKYAKNIKRLESGFSFMLVTETGIYLEHRIEFRASTSTWSIVYDWDVYNAEGERVAGLVYNCKVDDGKRHPSPIKEFYCMAMNLESARRMLDTEEGFDIVTQHTFSTLDG